ncbi:MAG: hypothetical protein RL115_424 [Bacteroidota bacterium]|jgi:mono/diheme cytochrome c family protein
MKKTLTLSCLAGVTVLLAYCCAPKPITTSKNGTKQEVPKTTFTNAISTIMAGSCSPCHIPSKGGNKRPYDNFANVKADIDEIIRRVEMEPGTRGFMPMKGQKLPIETIAQLKKWKADGMIEN